MVARQQMHAVRSVADQIEKEKPGAIHAVNFTFSGRRLQASIIYDRNRGVGDAQPGGEVDETTKPAQPRPTQPKQRKPKADKAKGSKGSDKTKATAAQGRADDAAMADADDAPGKAAAVTMRRHLTDATTDVVRALGGDSVTGRQLLCAEKTPLPHPVRSRAEGCALAHWLSGSRHAKGRAVAEPGVPPRFPLRRRRTVGAREAQNAQCAHAARRQGACASARFDPIRVRTVSPCPPHCGVHVVVRPTRVDCKLIQPATAVRRPKADAQHWRLSDCCGPDSLPPQGAGPACR